VIDAGSGKHCGAGWTQKEIPRLRHYAEAGLILIALVK
jgi:hypothetical protein